jgi:hypothetical protein
MADCACEKGDEWLNECVVLFRDGSRVFGRYDGYGGVDCIDLLDHEGDFELMHRRCWDAAGQPGFTKPSPDAMGQGYFYDDGTTPESERWQNMLKPSAAPALSQDKIEEHLCALRLGCDPESPFFGMVNFNELSELPVSNQHEIFNAMDDSLRAMVESFQARMEG